MNMKKCLACEKELEVGQHGIVYGATCWTTPGNYGSRVYDPMLENTYLEAFICDECLARKKSLVEEVTVIIRREENRRKEPNFG